MISLQHSAKDSNETTDIIDTKTGHHQDIIYPAVMKMMMMVMRMS